MSKLTPKQPARKTESGKSWLSPEMVSEIVPEMTERKLSELRKTGRGPRYYKPSPKTVIYERTDIDRWVSESVVYTRDDREVQP